MVNLKECRVHEAAGLLTLCWQRSQFTQHPVPALPTFAPFIVTASEDVLQLTQPKETHFLTFRLYFLSL